MDTPYQHIKLLLADDHPLLLKGLVEFLEEKGFRDVMQAKDGISAKNIIVSEQPTLAILDIDMPGMTGIEIAKYTKENNLATKVILLSYLKDPAFIIEAKAVNIYGYVIKEDALTELIRCIQTVLRGERYFSKKLQTVDTTELDEARTIISSLTRSELKILKLIHQGMSSREISDMLDVSTRTVEKHRSNIIFKLGIQGQSKALSQWLLENNSFL